MQSYNPEFTARDERAPAGSVRLLVLSGLLLLLGYIALVIVLMPMTVGHDPALVSSLLPPVFDPLRVFVRIPWEDAARATGADFAVQGAGAYYLVLCWLFGIYLYTAYRAFKSGAFPRRAGGWALAVILVGTALPLVALLYSNGMFSTDLIGYAWFGRILGVFGANPYTHVPSQYASVDTGNWLGYLFWKDLPPAYGPVWVGIAGGIGRIAQFFAGDNLAVHMLGHRLLSGVLHLVNVCLVWVVSGEVIRRYWPRPQALSSVAPGAGSIAVRTSHDWRTGAQVASTLAFAWNPLMLIEFGVSGHNDSLMIFFILAALALHLSGRWRLAVLALALASLVKITALMFLPGYLWLLFWQAQPWPGRPHIASRIARVAQGIAILGIAWVVFYAPLWEGPATLRPFVSDPTTQMYINSLGTIIRYDIPNQIEPLARQLNLQPAGAWTAATIGDQLNIPIRWALLALSGSIALLVTWPARSFRRMLAAWGWVAFAYLTLGAQWYWPWYASWLLLPAVLANSRRMLVASQLLAVGSLAIYGITPANSQQFAPLWAWAGLLVSGPALLYLLSTMKGVFPGREAAAVRAARIEGRAIARPATERAQHKQEEPAVANMRQAGSCEPNPSLRRGRA